MGESIWEKLAKGIALILVIFSIIIALEEIVRCLSGG
jgi:hypothetical protein